jgi:hypothetical protein
MASSDTNIILDGSLIDRLRAGLEGLFRIDDIQTPREAPQGTVLFIGSLLLQDSEAAYDLIAKRWATHQYTPTLRAFSPQQVALIAQPGLIIPKPSNPLINLVLAILTIISVLFTGAVYALPPAPDCQPYLPQTVGEWLAGLPMMLALMAILLAHEFGHYFAARYHKIAVTLPYFIPLPLLSPVGTMGAFIQLRAPFKTKKQLFDIGVAGPLGGLIFAIPLTFWGVYSSSVNPMLENPCGSALEGNSIFYLGVKYLVHGQLLPSFNAYANLSAIQEFLLLLGGVVPAESQGQDIFINALAFAAWFGLFVTAINLAPIGQLDGGHVLYCLLGERARWVGLVLIGGVLLAGIFWWTGWLLWGVLVFFVIGPGHPPPLNELAPLGRPRQILAYGMIFLFIILFMPNPLQPLG